MAQTISELEKERAELLQAIESQAQQFSSQRSTNADAPVEHTLKDWLNAAEEVMPTSPVRNTAAPRNANAAASAAKSTNKPATSKASFFGVIIMLSLLLTILGVLYIAYTSIHNELQKVMATNKNMNEAFTEMQAQVAELKNTVITGGKTESFDALKEKVAALETELNQLKAQQAELIKNPPAMPLAAQAVPVEQASEVLVAANAGNLVTNEVLDAKLKVYTEQIDSKLELIMQFLKIASPAENDASQSVLSPKAKEASSEKTFEPLTINEPQAPSIKTLDQPLVKLVKTVKLPEKPQEPSDPLKNYSPEVNWLMNEPAFNFTLQLASLADYASAQKMKDEKGLADAKIIPQTRNDVTSYVLLVGSFNERQAADKAANSLKANHNISPWVRKIKDLTVRVE
ncbi:SPOR domain-containing protein [Thiosulfativibrio zosterae]|uniref:SPOR domain-containing protein n=1 Tax=Thiosulfativibrio zosterae TaxID=2675053 RepID=A0A6F8PNK3_9GAMM|nr:SPOR domain-containing protein [Thiosulfativibrio zosterae]BBP43570.1 hypothetical protein THMIRHAT_13160 [Thiosulfativibrio zosterae]